MIAVAYFTATLEHGPPTHPRRGARKALQTLLLPALCLSCWCLLGLLVDFGCHPGFACAVRSRWLGHRADIVHTCPLTSPEHQC